ncbi:hypothetical protein [Chitinophaga rhizosphaerae]|uniref:hypothetical protein n=1 Tax=Chitinophaga rhizosphaerae TaxID=1864947 RepID=UPI000F814325|nr:hypothetical protein [Chitinophaga rhizosphaerae]
MIHLHDLKTGDLVLAKFEEQLSEGPVLQIDRELGQACVLVGEQENWYEPADLFPIPLTVEQLLKLKFKKSEETTINGAPDTYVRGPFTITLHSGSDPRTILHYRDETRNIAGHLMVHQLQNHYHGMTLFHLE